MIAEASHKAIAAAPAVHDDTRFGRLPRDVVAGVRRATLTSAVLPALAALRERVVAINACGGYFRRPRVKEARHATRR